jgi:hypothetical protein
VAEPGSSVGDVGESRRPFEPFTLAAGAERAIVLSGRTSCAKTALGRDAVLRSVDVRYKVLGLSKTRAIPLHGGFRLNPRPDVCDGV